MLWLKRNLVLVAAILAGALLAIFGGIYVFNNFSTNKNLDEELGKTKAELDRLTGAKPTVNRENVEAARKDVEQARKYSEECRKLFPPTPYQPVNSQTFKSMLETTLADLRRTGQQSGVDMVSNYNFSFEGEIRQLRFQQDTLKPLSEELDEIGAISRALFKAKVHRVEQIRRVAVSEYDSSGGQDILPGAVFEHDKPTGMVICPYEFTIQCFSGDLAAALTELGQVPRMVLIKMITVQPEAAGQPTGAEPGAPPPEFHPPPPGPKNRPPSGATPEAELKTALEEKLLRAVLTIHVVKPGAKS